MSDTPRTDAYYKKWQESWSREPINLDLCRQLERELAEAKFDLQFRRDLYALQSKELAEAREILIKCLSIMPVGYVPTHTVENLPEMIGDLAKALAEETTEREQLERELAEAREQRDALVNILTDVINEDGTPKSIDRAAIFLTAVKGELK